MTLKVGTRLGPHEIHSPLGAGGMGEVYRARDTRLGRDVAIKILPDEFSRDPQRLARFEREAQLLATLNHPNIAAIHELEEHDGLRYLVLEYVPGRTLAERIKCGAVPIDETIELCRQIAQALEAAHDAGIIHRDLKPANIKITPDEKVKVLDFGLAKDTAAVAAGADLSNSPTFTADFTQRGAVLGTAAYMSPEQARGKPVDRRTDIWAFGCVVYETLTARQAFGGETVSDSISAVLRAEPDWSALPAATPAALHRVLRRCLQKDLARRLRHIGDARMDLEEAVAAPAAVARARTSPPLTWLAWLLVAALAYVAGVGWWRVRTLRRTPAAVRHFTIPLPPGELFVASAMPAVAIAPDGSRIAFVSQNEKQSRLYVRFIDRSDSAQLPDTDGAMGPFFSPDGESLAFFADGKLKKISVHGGPAVILADAPNPRGGVWLPDGNIVFNPERSPTAGLMKVSARGGIPEKFTTPQGASGELNDRWPDVLPGGTAVIFTTELSGEALYNSRINVQTLDGRRRTVFDGGSNPRYVSSGHLVYARAGALLAVPFDLQRLEVTGEPIPVVNDLRMEWSGGAAHFGVSRDGSLVYVAGGLNRGPGPSVWVDRNGREQPLTSEPAFFPRLSPDGQRLLLHPYDSIPWIYDLARAVRTRLSPGGRARSAIWNPEGRITLGLLDNSVVSLMPDGGGAEELLQPSAFRRVPAAWSPDGRLLALAEEHPGATRTDIWLLEMRIDGPKWKRGEIRPFLQSRFDETQPTFSPDGRWIAYRSDESGRPEVHVRSVTGEGGGWQISNGGGAEPLWSPRGRELFYTNSPQFLAVDVQTTPDFRVGKPRVLFEWPNRMTGSMRNYDISPDGQRFVITKSRDAPPVNHVNIVHNFAEELRRRLPPAKK